MNRLSLLPMSSSYFPPPPFGKSTMLPCDDPFNKKLLQFSLIGKFISDEMPRVGRVMAILARVSPGAEVHQLSSHIFILIFPFEGLKLSFKLGSPWVIDGKLLVLEDWKIHVPFHRLTFSYVPCWVQLHGLDDIYANDNDVAVIASIFPKLLLLASVGPQEQKDYGKYRIRVILDLVLPLIGGWVIRDGMSRSVVRFRYEKLPVSCKLCGFIGHKDCILNQEMEGSPVITYGPPLQATVPPSEVICPVVPPLENDMGDVINILDMACVGKPSTKRKRTSSGSVCGDKDGNGWDIHPYHPKEFRRILKRSVQLDKSGHWLFDTKDVILPDDLLQWVFSYGDEGHKSAIVKEWENEEDLQGRATHWLEKLCDLVSYCDRKLGKGKTTPYVFHPFPEVDLALDPID